MLFRSNPICLGLFVQATVSHTLEESLFISSLVALERLGVVVKFDCVTDHTGVRADEADVQLKHLA